MQSMMTPVLALVCWTLLMLAWLAYARFTIGFRQSPKAMKLKRTQDLAQHLPDSAVWAADNYNHLHEQPTIFYALAIYSHLVGVSDPLNVGLAWAYVGLRVLHSLIHATSNVVLFRFVAFLISSMVLLVIAVRNLIALFAG